MDKTDKKETRKNKLKALETREAEALATFKWLPFFKLIFKTMLFAFVGLFRFFFFFTAACAVLNKEKSKHWKQTKYEQQVRRWKASGCNPAFAPRRDKSW